MLQSKRFDDLITLLKCRRSIRKFKPEQIPDDVIEKLIGAAVTAPSAGNQQNWEFIVVKSPDVKSLMRKAVEEKIAQITQKLNSQKAKNEFLSYSRYYTFFDKAPVVIAVVVKPYDSITGRIMKLYKIESEYVSTANIQGPAAAIENLLLAACAFGYGTCWMTGPLIAKNSLEKILGIKKPDELMALIPVGVPDEFPSPRNRKDPEEVMKIL